MYLETIADSNHIVRDEIYQGWKAAYRIVYRALNDTDPIFIKRLESKLEEVAS